MFARVRARFINVILNMNFVCGERLCMIKSDALIYLNVKSGYEHLFKYSHSITNESCELVCLKCQLLLSRYFIFTKTNVILNVYWL